MNDATNRDNDVVSAAGTIDLDTTDEFFNDFIRKKGFVGAQVEKDVQAAFDDALAQHYRAKIRHAVFKLNDEPKNHISEKEFTTKLRMDKSTTSRRIERENELKLNPVKPKLVNDFKTLFVGAGGFDTKFGSGNIPSGFDAVVAATLDTITYVRIHYLQEECSRITEIERACLIVTNSPYWAIAAQQTSKKIRELAAKRALRTIRAHIGRPVRLSFEKIGSTAKPWFSSWLIFHYCFKYDWKYPWRVRRV